MLRYKFVKKDIVLCNVRSWSLFYLDYFSLHRLTNIMKISYKFVVKQTNKIVFKRYLIIDLGVTFQETKLTTTA